MSMEALATKYIDSAEKVLAIMQREHGTLTVSEKQVNNIVECVKAYLEDAKYYKAQKKLEISLTSIAYCEGLLDALKLIGAVKFEWPVKKARKQ
jgi:FAD synthetase